jgi:adenine/guanine phosphoribosyltransferase-like PRPP-binding protein
MAIGDISHELAFLRTEFLHDAKVIDHERGYISVPSFNLRMKPSVLSAAADIIAHEFRNDHIDIIHGIPHSGNYLATAVALKLNQNIRLHSSRKDQNIPTAWKDVYREEIRSYTTGGSGFHVFSGINLSFVQKGDRVLLVDDVCATGETGHRVASGLAKRGVNIVGFAVLFDKVFQGGLANVASLGIKVYSCIHVTRIDKGDVVILDK